MCLAEALLRVPDATTIDELIEDKIAPSSWGEHLGASSSSLVNASTWALMLTGKILKEPASDSMADVLRSAVKRLGEPVIRLAVKRAMKEMGHQFVLGQTIHEARKRGRDREHRGFTYSYDMLGEAALTAKDAQGFYDAYAHAISVLSADSASQDIRENPGISIKLSALHPRYETSQKDRVFDELVPSLLALAQMAKRGRMGLNIDAEEAGRLDLSLDVIERVMRSADLDGWDGFGVVVQAYDKRAFAVIDWLYNLAGELDRRIMVRLVKGAYWDTEIKRAQVDGVVSFPVYTDKVATDVSYVCCAKKLLLCHDRIFPQFATHNAHTVAAILELADDRRSFEFQRLHGMGEALHDLIKSKHDCRCRIYAPVGAHRDLLAYLVRRLLENGANSSFVNQIVDNSIAAEEIASDPFRLLKTARTRNCAGIKKPGDLYAHERKNSAGWDLSDPNDIDRFHFSRNPFLDSEWSAKPLIAGEVVSRNTKTVINPADPQARSSAASSSCRSPRPRTA